MPQILVAPNSIQSGHFSVDGAEAHHLTRVLRAKVGDEINLFDGQGHRYRGRIIALDAVSARGEILDELPFTEKSHRLHLYQGIPKGSKIEYVIEKAVELGVDSIVPFLSEKNIVKLDGKQAEAKVNRWQKIATAAAKQCGRAEIPVIAEPRPLNDLLERFRTGLTLFFSVEEKHQSLKSVLAARRDGEQVVNIIIGPESGFSKKEASSLIESGAWPVSLGQRVLRTETAGLTALSILNYELGL